MADSPLQVFEETDTTGSARLRVTPTLTIP